MNKILIAGIILSLLFAGLVLAEKNNQETVKNMAREIAGKVINYTITKTTARECEGAEQGMLCNSFIEREIEIERAVNMTMTRLAVRNISVEINGSIQTINNRTLINWNNITREIKIMPDTANIRALERLQIRACNSENNCSIQLKQVGTNNETAKLQYEVTARTKVRWLWFFSRWKDVSATVDAETGAIN